MGNKKPLIITAGILFFLLIIASSAYGVLAYTAQPANVNNISAGQSNADGASDASLSESSDQETGQKVEAPDFVVLGEAGEEISLSSFKGKPVVVNFWTSWCTYCKQEMPDYQEVYEKYGDKVQFMMINVTADVRESKELADAFIAEHDYTFPYYFDVNADAINSYTVRSYPTTYVIDADGYIAGYAAGMLDGETLADSLELLL